MGQGQSTVSPYPPNLSTHGHVSEQDIPAHTGATTVNTPSGPITMALGAKLGPISQFSAAGLVTFPKLPTMPSKVDLRQTTCNPYPPIYDQGTIGSCTSNSTAALYACAQRRLKVDSDSLIMPSRLFNYYYSRWLGDHEQPGSGINTSADTGSTNTLAMDVMGGSGGKQDGVVSDERFWPYDPTGQGYLREPDEKAQDASVYNTVTDYGQIDSSVDNLRNCLAHGYPFILGFYLTNAMLEWMQRQVPGASSGGGSGIAQPYVLPAAPNTLDTSNIAGGHSVTAVGYDDNYAGGCFLIRNSWGANWGDKGHFWIRYNDIENGSYYRDFFYVKDIQSSVFQPATSSNPGPVVQAGSGGRRPQQPGLIVNPTTGGGFTTQVIPASPGAPVPAPVPTPAPVPSPVPAPTPGPAPSPSVHHTPRGDPVIHTCPPFLTDCPLGHSGQ